MGVFSSITFLLGLIIREIKTLYLILFSPISGNSHKERLESFYKTQAGNYDAYRKRLLHGREEMFAQLGSTLESDKKSDLVWVDLGAGTGYNLECMDGGLKGGLAKTFKKVYLVDLSTSLLKQAQERIDSKQWTSVVETVEADATKWKPTGGKGDGLVDVVTFSYSLTMIPDWFLAIDHAVSILKPGGILAIVDFYVGRKYPKEDEVKHSWFTRTFWRTFFACDNVRLNDDHMPFTESRDVDTLYKKENLGGVPYIPFVKAPHYILLVQKK
eukprot:TRINITY_DN1117_c0_g1_i1.p1 TRINITY_DN1117_c0_g1~~TRINITY_DN1117_c0_g1_i1.p1  ORF type:complete len:271 (+),score=70.38 TRINITY_DN1117_c0_g1_i1:83-895(+)